MKTMAAGEFKAKCLAVIDEVKATGEAILITKRGKPVAKLMPFATDSSSLIGALSAKLRIKGDILSTGVAWNAKS